MVDPNKPVAPFHPGDDAPAGSVVPGGSTPDEIADLERGDNDRDNSDDDDEE